MPTLPHPPTLLFRGHADASYTLKPSLLRLFHGRESTERALDIEMDALKLFHSHAQRLRHSTWIPPHPTGDRVLPELLALMQHHGAPTRLLDWTASPYVAAYFAAAKSPDKDGVIYVVPPDPFIAANGTLDRLKDTDFGDEPGDAKLFFFGPAAKTERVAAQQGHFSICTSNLSDHEGPILKVDGSPSRNLFGRWTIPAALKVEFLRHLQLMNVTARTLFPGVDGLGASVAESVVLSVAEDLRIALALTNPQPPAPATPGQAGSHGTPNTS